MGIVELVEKPAEANLAEQIDAITRQIYQFADRVEHIADTIFELIGNVDPTGSEDSGQVGDLKKAMTLAEMLTEVGKTAGPIGGQLEGIAQKLKGGPAKRPWPQTQGDAAIIEAWETWKSARGECQASKPARRTEDPTFHSWDDAEREIQHSTATTPCGVKAQLLVALSVVSENEDVAALAAAGDVNGLLAIEQGGDWADSLVIAALRSLQAMEESYGPA